ncbi:MAG: hypothetical protein CM15mP4_2790 [Candidatus Neomarinimicrobiota bacterium]|nr:MAG: hypothetical protein CM15mP4_2790 [Candidatus Neomarinimicrobiota bacterium]
MEKEKLGFNTKAIHVGNEPDEVTGAVIPSIHTSSTFQQEAVGVHKDMIIQEQETPLNLEWRQMLQV